MCLDNTPYDYATNIDCILHFDSGVTVDEAKQVEVYLVCCRFAVFSTTLTVTKTFDGSVVGKCSLMVAPNLLPLRHTTWATQSWIKIREVGRCVKQVDVHMHSVLTYKLMEDHYFLTPAKLPVRVSGGMAMFNRKMFLESVPDAFRHRYVLPEEVQTPVNAPK